MLPAGFYDDDGRRALVVVGLLQPGKVKEKSLCHKNTYLLGKFSAEDFHSSLHKLQLSRIFFSREKCLKDGDVTVRRLPQ